MARLRRNSRQQTAFSENMAGRPAAKQSGSQQHQWRIESSIFWQQALKMKAASGDSGERQLSEERRREGISRSQRQLRRSIN